MKTIFQIIPVLSILIAVSCHSVDDPKTAVNDGYIKTSGDIELYYLLAGTGSDTLVVVHGGPGAGIHSIMEPVMPLADDFLLIFYDQRGGGKSTLPEDTDLLHRDYFIEDLEAVRRHFNLESMNILAHSFGSLITAEYAKQYPERVNRMVFTAAVGPSREQAAVVYQSSPPSPDTILTNRAGMLLSELLQGTAEDPVSNCIEYEEISQRLAELRNKIVTWTGTSCEAPSEAIAYYYQFTAQITPRTFGNWDYTSGMDHIQAPLLVIHGARDTLSVDSQYSWSEVLPNGNLIAVPEAGKTTITDQPEFVVPAIRDFLETNL